MTQWSSTISVDRAAKMIQLPFRPLQRVWCWQLLCPWSLRWEDCAWVRRDSFYNALVYVIMCPLENTYTPCYIGHSGLYWPGCRKWPQKRHHRCKQHRHRTIRPHKASLFRPFSFLPTEIMTWKKIEDNLFKLCFCCFFSSHLLSLEIHCLQHRLYRMWTQPFFSQAHEHSGPLDWQVLVGLLAAGQQKEEKRKTQSWKNVIRDSRGKWWNMGNMTYLKNYDQLINQVNQRFIEFDAFALGSRLEPCSSVPASDCMELKKRRPCLSPKSPAKSGGFKWFHSEVLKMSGQLGRRTSRHGWKMRQEEEGIAALHDALLERSIEWFLGQEDLEEQHETKDNSRFCGQRYAVNSF